MDASSVCLVLIGASGAGKTALGSKFVYPDSLPTDYTPTIGVDFFQRSLCVDGGNVLFKIYDSAGQERYHSMAQSYFRQADVALLCYDIANENESELRYWHEAVRKSTCAGLVLVGCKADLRPDAPALEFEGMTATVTSALSGAGVEAAFVAAYREKSRREALVSASERPQAPAQVKLAAEQPGNEAHPKCSC
jgi:small GTP-binding protein